MKDTAKMLLLVAGFMVLVSLAVIFKSVLLLCVIVAIVTAFTTALVHEPYKVITVKPRAKSVEVLEIVEPDW